MAVYRHVVVELMVSDHRIGVCLYRVYAHEFLHVVADFLLRAHDELDGGYRIVVAEEILDRLVSGPELRIGENQHVRIVVFGEPAVPSDAVAADAAYLEARNSGLIQISALVFRFFVDDVDCPAAAQRNVRPADLPVPVLYAFERRIPQIGVEILVQETSYYLFRPYVFSPAHFRSSSISRKISSNFVPE